MEENTNKTIAINSLINYGKMFVNTILVLLTTRYALQALGVIDFGLFSVLGSIISFIGIFNTIMLSTSNRFLAVEIGKGNIEDINKQFNVNLVIFIGIALLMFIIAYPVGGWYVHKYINYDGPISNAMMVFTLSILGSIFSTLATPYNGLLMAKERFIVFSSVEVFVYVIKFIIVYLLVSHFESKLFIYTATMAIMTALPAIIYCLYCKRYFPEYVKWNFVRDKGIYAKVFSFSGWVGFGAVAYVARNQGAVLLVNTFFNTVMNTALGIANSLNTYVAMFAHSLTQPMQPQITKSYAVGNIERTDELLIMSTKFSFMLMLLIGCPFFVGADWILGVWLGKVPAYTTAFTILLIIDNLVSSFNSGISTLLFASGKIAMYQVVINCLRLLAIAVAYFVLSSGAEPYSLFITYIIFSSICILASQWCLYKTLHYNTRNLYVKSYIPSILTLALFLPVLLLPASIHQVVKIIISLPYLLVIEFFVGLSRNERIYILSKIRK